MQPGTITRKLKSFQLEGLDWMVKQEKSHWKGGLLGDEMGMGKTIQAVSLVMSDYPAKDPTLVVVVSFGCSCYCPVPVFITERFVTSTLMLCSIDLPPQFFRNMSCTEERLLSRRSKGALSPCGQTNHFAGHLCRCTRA